MTKGKILKFDVKGIAGRQVRRLRRGAGMTQDDLARRCGIFRTYLSRIENGTANTSITVLAALATSLNVKIQDLFIE
ncbi:MAG: helix-turn-helix transcriptional regulator [Rhodoferax sp.]|nr:helix-turn-helix transcriptional regulator [Rhodoferax sp.]